MSDLTKFRDHCRAMAQGEHTSECVGVSDEAKCRWDYFRMFREWPERWGEPPTRPPEPCGGACLSEVDKALFARLADEVDAYLSTDDEPLWADA